MSTGRDTNERSAGGIKQWQGLLLSVLFHLGVLAALILWLSGAGATQIVAAGPGEGGEGGGGAIEIGVADPSSIFGFAKPQPVSFTGTEDSPVNNTKVETIRPEAASDDVLLPPTERDKPVADAIKTNRPVANQQERIFTGKDERGRSTNQSAQVGRSFGTPTPSMAGGVGIGAGGGSGTGTGLPGGSEYGRRIQAILSRYYNPVVVESANIEYVVIVLRIARDGSILSISNGRVNPAFIKRRSSNSLINAAAERAVLAANPLPPFPASFLSGVPVAEAEVWFRYPK